MPLRNFTRDRLPALLDFVEECNARGSQGRELGRKAFQEVLEQPGLTPSHNCLLLEEARNVRGYCLVFPELPISRTVLELKVAPDLAGGSLEREALRWGVARATELGARVAHLCLEKHGPRPILLEDEGFSPVRTYWDMVWQQEAISQRTIPDGFSVRSFRHGDASLLTEVQNAAFAGSWGFCPNTMEQIEYRTLMTNTSHDGILFLHQGEKPAGYCWTCITPVTKGIRGLIGMIGVVPDYRGQGVSPSILLAGMEYLRSVDVVDIGLQVDESNIPAIRLYKSVGFEKAGDRYWFERELGRSTTLNC